MNNPGDQIDRANELADLEREMRVAAIRANAKPQATATGRCLFCDEILDDERRWCDADCRDGWEKEAAARRRHGA